MIAATFGIDSERGPPRPASLCGSARAVYERQTVFVLHEIRYARTLHTTVQTLEREGECKLVCTCSQRGVWAPEVRTWIFRNQPHF